MAWLEIHQAVRDHRKTQELAVRLDMPEPHVVGHLTFLWLWALDNAPDGRLPRSARIIARAAWWDGEADTWVDSLRACGWIDDEDGDLRIHDWDVYGGKLCDQRRANAVRQQRFRERKQDVTVTSPLSNAPENSREHNTREEKTLTPSVSPLPIEPEPTEPEQTTTVKAVPKPRPSRIPDEFEITPSMWKFAGTTGLDEALVLSETEKFLDHFKAKGEKKSDWVAAWRNWLRNVPSFAPRFPPPRSPEPNGRTAQVAKTVNEFLRIGGVQSDP